MASDAPGRSGEGSEPGSREAVELERFVQAQETGSTYRRALAELSAGRKRSHWIWFVFPQLAGLGHSETSKRYATRGIEEARAYLAHPLLGPRLRRCAAALLELDTRDPGQVLGTVDALKLRSSMTLFAAAAAGSEPVFARVLDAFYDGVPDAATERLLGRD